MSRPLRMDPIEEARRQWAARWPDAPAGRDGRGDHRDARPAGPARPPQRRAAARSASTFPRYEALMLLLVHPHGRAAARQGRRAPAGPPDERDEHRRQARARRPRRAASRTRGPPRHARRDHPRGPARGHRRDQALHAIDFALGALEEADQERSRTCSRPRVAAGDFAAPE